MLVYVSSNLLTFRCCAEERSGSADILRLDHLRLHGRNHIEWVWRRLLDVHVRQDIVGVSELLYDYQSKSSFPF